MQVEGLVYRIDDNIYLSLVEPDGEGCTDGVAISEGVYETLLNNQISFVDVKITDGTMDIEMDIYDFVGENQKHEPGDIFYNIKDLQVFSFFENDNEDEPAVIKDICESGDFLKIVENIIREMRYKKINEN